MKNFAIASLLISGLVVAQVPTPIKWATIGNSITQGVGATTSYPVRLGTKLGAAFVIENDGVSGTTLLKKGDMPYWTRGRLTNVFAFRPSIITIKLGTNDTKTQNWQYGSEFATDLTAMIDTLAAMPSRPQIWLVLPVPIFPNTFGIRDSILRTAIIPIINQVAATKGLNVIDAYNPLKNFPALFPDGVHPNDAGADSIASIIYRAFVSKATRIACVGNSITAGATLANAGSTAYPILLNMLLGRGYYVKNEGVSGAYMQKSGALPYWSTAQFTDVFRYKPNIITIALGTNDSRVTRWNGARFRTDYNAMIDTFNTIIPQPRIWSVKPMPAWYAINNSSVTPTVMGWGFDNGIAGNGISGFTIRDSVIPSAQQVATQRALSTIDLYVPMLMGQPYTYNVTPSWVPDGVHPRELGHDTIAHVFFRALTAPVGISGRKTVQESNRSAAAYFYSQGRYGFDPYGWRRLFTLDGKSSSEGTGVFFISPAAAHTPLRERIPLP